MNLFVYRKFNQPNTWCTWFGHLHQMDHLILETFKFTSKESELAKCSILKSLSFFFDISCKKLFFRFSYISNCLLCNFDFKSKRMQDNRQKDVLSIYTLFEFAHFFWFTEDFTHFSESSMKIHIDCRIFVRLTDLLMREILVLWSTHFLRVKQI